MTSRLCGGGGVNTPRGFAGSCADSVMPAVNTAIASENVRCILTL
jgi:hypothetical protein